MAFTLEQITTGVRQALYGREVREWIAQMGEWVYRWVGEQTATVQSALTTMKTLEEQARTSKTSAADSAAKAEQAYKDAAAATRTATQKAESAETSSNLAKTAKENAQGSASAAKTSENASKGYLDQIKVIANGAQGWYATPMALQNAVPSGQNGWWAIVGSTDTIWVWDSDSGAWAESGGTVDLSGYYTKNDVDTKLNGKSDTGHTHDSVKDIGNNSSDTTFAYSKSGLAYGNYSWLAGWNGYELRAVDKTQFATSSHTHNYAGSSSAGGTATSVNGFKIVAQTSDPGAGSSLATNTILLVYK